MLRKILILYQSLSGRQELVVCMEDLELYGAMKIKY